MRRAIEEKTNVLPVKFGKAQIVVGLQLNYDGLLGAGNQFHRVPQSGGDDFDGPKGHGIARRELTGGAGHGFGIK